MKIPYGCDASKTRYAKIGVEELSAKVMLDGLMPRVLPNTIHYQCVVFSGKGDLEKRLGWRLRAWREPNVCFVVVRDQDSGDCLVIKQQLLEICRAAGKRDAMVRIACRELESWYLADLSAVEAGLGLKGLAKNQVKKKFRHPDDLHSPSRELERLTNGMYQKVAGSRAIGPYLEVDNRRSNSFRVFIEALQHISGPHKENRPGNEIHIKT